MTAHLKGEIMTKRILTMMACAVVASTLFTMGCSKKSPDAPTTTPAAAPEAAKTEATLSTSGTGGLSPQQIADAVSKTVCKRMTACNPQGGSETDCISGLSKDMAGNLSDKAKAIAQAQLDTCMASITKATCEQLAAPTPPAGCEFMD
jgi:hypothetical protein